MPSSKELHRNYTSTIHELPTFLSASYQADTIDKRADIKHNEQATGLGNVNVFRVPQCQLPVDMILPTSKIQQLRCHSIIAMAVLIVISK
jgi:hypothetical protein